MTLLALDGLRAGYGRTEILHGVDLRVPQGTVVALLGSNGAGKSTLLKTVAGLLHATGGALTFDGRRVDGESPHQRVREGMCLIPEGRGIFRNLTVRENLAMQVGTRKVKPAIELATGHFPILGRRLAQRAGTMSGGEQQMLAVSRALVTEPKLIMADELSVGLAPVVVDQIFDAIRSIRSQGCSLLIVEQYVGRALELADYVYILQKGRIAFVGEPEQCASGEVFEQYLGGAA
jgi:branched-chain amino acid transport system ATP-binding protein